MICSRKIFLGYGLIILGVICFVSSGAAVQALQRAVPDFELGLFRYSGATLTAGIIIAFQRNPLHVPKGCYFYIVIMGVTSLLFNFFYYFAASILPLAHVSGLHQSFRMISFSILISYVSRTSQDKLIVVAILGCTLGAFFVVQPWSGFSNGFIPGFLEVNTTSSLVSHENISHETDLIFCGGLHNTGWIIAGYTCLLLGSITDAFYLLAVGVHLRHVDSFIQVFFSSLLCVPVSLIMSLYMEQPTVILNPLDILYVLIHVTGMTVAIIVEVVACKIIDPVQIAIIQNLSTIINLVPQYTVMTSYLYGRRNVMEVVGCIVITLSLMLSGLPSVGNQHEDL